MLGDTATNLHILNSLLQLIEPNVTRNYMALVSADFTSTIIIFSWKFQFTVHWVHEVYVFQNNARILILKVIFKSLLYAWITKMIYGCNDSSTKTTLLSTSRSVQQMLSALAIRNNPAEAISIFHGVCGDSGVTLTFWMRSQKCTT